MTTAEIVEVIDTKLVTKGAGAITATVEAVPDAKATDPNGEFNLILATPDRDREGDELKPHEWKLPLPDYISIDTDHAMTTEKTIGGGAPQLLDNGDVLVPCTYAGTQHAQETRKLLTSKHVRGASATYLQRTLKLKDGTTIVQRELLNGTVTPIPANTKAKIVSSKSLDNPADAANIAQRMHDDANKLGAMCNPAVIDVEDEENGPGSTDAKAKSVTLTIVSKAIKGSVEELNDRVRRAVRDAHPDGYPYIRATFLDSPGKGTVVYEHGDGQTLARGFTDDGTVTTVEAQPRPVTLQTAVLEHDADEPADMATKALDLDAGPLERALEILVANGMTREAACKHLDIGPTGANLAASEGSPAVGTPPADAVPADEAATAEAVVKTKAAGSQNLELRTRTLAFDLENIAAG